MLDTDQTRTVTHRRPVTGPPCDLVTVPAREGLEAVDILRLRDDLGPVLHDRAGDTLGFLVPPGTAAGWDLPGSACTPIYDGPIYDGPVYDGPVYDGPVYDGPVYDGPVYDGPIYDGPSYGALERAAAAAVVGTGTAWWPPPVTGCGWLFPPGETVAPATEPEQLRAALREAARTLAAVDRCC